MSAGDRGVYLDVPHVLVDGGNVPPFVNLPQHPADLAVGRVPESLKFQLFLKALPGRRLLRLGQQPALVPLGDGLQLLNAYLRRVAVADRRRVFNPSRPPPDRLDRRACRIGNAGIPHVQQPALDDFLPFIRRDFGAVRRPGVEGQRNIHDGRAGGNLDSLPGRLSPKTRPLQRPLQAAQPAGCGYDLLGGPPAHDAQAEIRNHRRRVKGSLHVLAGYVVKVKV